MGSEIVSPAERLGRNTFFVDLARRTTKTGSDPHLRSGRRKRSPTPFTARILFSSVGPADGTIACPIYGHDLGADPICGLVDHCCLSHTPHGVRERLLPPRMLQEAQSVI